MNNSVRALTLFDDGSGLALYAERLPEEVESLPEHGEIAHQPGSAA